MLDGNRWTLWLPFMRHSYRRGRSISLQKIVPSLWFDQNTEEAVTFYIDLFNGSPHKGANSRLISLARYEQGMDVPGAEHMEGKVLTAIFELNGQRFMALGGDRYDTDRCAARHPR
jgi:predicted 3-demethylubiquinone-9 3-methyltransferase (glyoxalase superfamily)